MESNSTPTLARVTSTRRPLKFTRIFPFLPATRIFVRKSAMSSTLLSTASSTTTSYLQVSPFNNRRKIRALINREIHAAKSGRKAIISLKLNNLVDDSIIRQLYAASQAGVKIRMIVRGMCPLKPGIEGVSDNISINGNPNHAPTISI